MIKSYAGMDEGEGEGEGEPMDGVAPVSPTTPAPPPAKRGRAGGSSRRTASKSTGASAHRTPAPHAGTPGVSTGKTPLKSPATRTKAALTPNNDSRERLERRDSAAAEKLQRRRSNLASAVDGNPEQGTSVPMLSGQQLADLYTNCIKLAQSNKISQKNAWSLDLINHLGIAVKNLDEVAVEDEEEGSFAKASLSLDAATKIYGYRVDSVHKDAFHVLGTVTSNILEKENQEGASDAEEDDADDEEGAEASAEQARKEREIARRLKATKKKGNFIAKSVDEINMKTPFARSMRNDPTFAMLTEWRAKSGIDALLCQNIIPNGGPRLSLDPDEGPMEEWHEDFIVDGLPPHEQTMDPDVLQGIVDDLEKVVMDDEPIVPCVDELYHLAEKYGVIPSIAEWEAKMGFPLPMADVVDAALNDQIQAHATGPPAQEDEWRTDDGFGGGEDDVQLGALGDGPDDAFEDERNAIGKAAFSFGFSAEEEFICELPESIARSWAGASHWRFKTKKLAVSETPNAEEPTVNETDEAAHARSGRRAPADPALEFNFSALPDVNWAEALASPKASKDTTLKETDSRTSAEPTLLPDDLKYEPRELLRLFLNPEVSYSSGYQKGMRSSPRGVVDNLAHEDMGYSGGDDDGGFAEFGGMDEGRGQESPGVSATANRTGPLSLLQDMALAPKTVNGVKYARMAKSVDVRALKDALWTEIREEFDAANAEGGGSDGISFRKLARDAPIKHMAAEYVEDVSVHMSFITLLHLANENGLRIEGCHAMDELLIYDQSR